MTTQEIRAGFDQMIAAAEAAGNTTAADNFRLAREYHTNPAFRRQLEDAVWNINNAPQAA